MSSYRTVLTEAVSELTEKHSKFIGHIAHCESEEQAVAFIDSIRSKHWDSRHNVFAYSIRENNLKRFSDDGEPHGTAGKPVLDVIDGNNLTNVVLVVTRYFGGILLGTGGLVRSYSTSASQAVEKSVISEMFLCSKLEIRCSYSDHGKLINIISRNNGQIIKTEFTDDVLICFYLKKEIENYFNKQLSEAFSCRVFAKNVEEEYISL